MSSNNYDYPSTKFANFYDGKNSKGEDFKINKGALYLNVNPIIATQFKARMMYLAGGYPVSQTHVFKDAITPTLNGILNNINRELSNPDSALYDGLGIAKDQINASTEYMETVCRMAEENRYKNKYITKTQIENRIEKIYGHKFIGYPNPTLVRKVDLKDYHSSYKVKDMMEGKDAG